MWPLLRSLRRDQPLSVYFFAVPHFSLNLMGYWPTGKELPVRAIVHFAILSIGVVTELHAGFKFLQQAQITLALETLCPAGTSAVTLLKMLLMLHYRQDLASIWKRLQRMLFDEGLNRPKQLAIMHAHAVMAARINFWPLSTGFFTCTTYNLKPLLIALVLYLQDPKKLLWNTPFNMTMPKFLLEAPFFPLTYAFIAYTGYVTIFMFGGCDGFYFECCAHISSLFQALQEELRAIFRPYEDYLKLTPAQSAHLEVQLIGIIARQNAVFELTNFFRTRYAIITLAHFVSAALVIGFSIFNLLTVGNNTLGALLYVAYTVAALSQLLVYCYGGTLLADSSVEISRVAATCPWTVCEPRQRRIILLIILRSQRAPTMAVPFFSPSLSTFASILQTSGSIIAFSKSFQ